MLKKILSSLLFTLTFLYAFSQNTLIETSKPEDIFRNGMELLVREKYAAARKTFEKYQNYLRNQNQNQIRNERYNLRYADAQYYIAYCALNLFNPDAEELFQHFMEEYPWHSKASLGYYELGDFFYNTKKYQKAIDYLKKADPGKLTSEQRTELYFKLGYSYFSQKEFERAEEFFDRVKNGRHKYVYAARYYSGYLKLKSGKFDEALRDLQEAEKNESYAAVVPYLIANVYYQQGNYDQLIDYSESALQRTDVQEKEELDLLLAEAFFKKEDYVKSVEYFEAFAKKRKGKLSTPLLYRLAYSQYMTGKYEEAIRNFAPIATLKDGLGQAASYYLGQAYLKTDDKQSALLAFQQAARMDFSKEIQEDALFNYAKVNADLENFSEAVSALRLFNRKYPKSMHAQEADELLSEALLKTSNYTEAINFIESLKARSLRINAAYQRVTFYKGVEEFNNENFEQAIEMFNKSTDFPIDKDVYLSANYWKGEAYSILHKYPEAISAYEKVFQNSRQGNEYRIKSYYGIAYAYYNTQQYDKARTKFKEYTEEVGQPGKYFYDDAVLRLADIYAYDKEYPEALRYYNLAIETRNPDLDYAQYRKGLVLTFEQKDDQAIEAYDKVIDLYPNSLYYDDALYHKAEIIFTQGNFEQAVALFTQLIRQQSNSPYIPNALNFRAIAYRNLGQLQLAIDDYKRILTEFPKDPVAEEALSGLQIALSRADRSEEFEMYREEFAKNNPGSKSLVSIDYEAARSLYNNQKYDKAITAFKNYMSHYPDSPNGPDARYFLAESYLKANQTEEAVHEFKSVIAERKTSYFTRAILRLAGIYFDQKEFEEAKEYYLMLLANSNNPRERSIGWAALMETYFKLNLYDSVQYYADLLLNQSKYSMDANKATLYLGKIAYQRDELEKATDYFLSTINLAKDENAAEAKYMIAKIQYDQKQYKQSLETLYDLNNTYYVYSKWLAKSFLLIADNFIAMDELFQAKATLNSIIEKSDQKDAVEEAKKKLAELDKKEAESSGKEGNSNE